MGKQIKKPDFIVTEDPDQVPLEYAWPKDPTHEPWPAAAILSLACGLGVLFAFAGGIVLMAREVTDEAGGRVVIYIAIVLAFIALPTGFIGLNQSKPGTSPRTGAFFGLIVGLVFCSIFGVLLFCHLNGWDN